MNRRAGFFAFQALLTAALVGVIVVTLINPNGQVSLFRVDVPGAGNPVAQGPPSYEPAEEGGQGGDGGPGRTDRGPAGGGAGEGAFAPPSAGVAGVTGDGEVPPAISPPAPADEGAQEGPAGEQYGDTVARLSDAVN